MKKGFTLIELLAVILILGIIALIAIPTITKILEESRKGAFKTTLYQINKSIETQCTTEQIKNLSPNIHYVITNGEIKPKVDIKGKLPDGDIYVDNDCAITFKLFDENYVGIKNTINANTIIEKNNGINSKYKESILYGADPELDSGMIPVTISNDGKVIKADTKNNWYKYSESKWANSVIVKEDKRYNYLMAPADTLINSADILGYFVWIPRYKYKIPNVLDVTNPPLIDIKFENKYTKKSNDDYHTHPAFTFGKIELNGIWVGKFETTTLTSSCVNEATCKDVDPSILPNVKSLRHQNIKQQFITSKKLNNSMYGINNDSHLMKGTEWSSVSYLSHSLFGRSDEVRLNNNIQYLTGCGANNNDGEYTNTCDNAYGSNLTVYPQSTTNNITGIFDMSGGTYERTMTNYNKTNLNSGFNTNLSDLDPKYYDLITSTDISKACDNSICYGYGFSETDGWYNDSSNYHISTNMAWMGYGGESYDNSMSGIFSKNPILGQAISNYTFRITIS